MTWSGFENKVIVITGGSRGVGLAIALDVASRGANVALIARSMEDLEVARDQLEGPSTRHLSVVADAGDQDSLAQGFKRIEKELGPIDVLINNAGIGQFGPTAEIAEKDFEHLLNVNVLGVHRCTKLVLEQMKKRGSGVIINIASIAGRIGAPYEAAYSASKFAVVGYSEALRSELDGTGIRVILIDPGPVDTEFFQRRGAPYERSKPKPVSAKSVAQAVVRAIVRNKDELFVPGWLASALKIKFLVPFLYKAGSRADLARARKEGSMPS